MLLENSIAHKVYVLVMLTEFLTAGCGMVPSRPSEPTHTYILTADIQSGRKSVGPNAGTLLVNQPLARSGFNTQQMAYVKRDNELNYFAYNQWAETPARMLHPLLVSALESTNRWAAVVHMPSPVRGDYLLISENLLLQHEFTQEPSRVRIHLRLQLIRFKNFDVVGTREFTVLEKAQTDDPYGGVQAANAATERLLKEIENWVSRCMAEPTDGRC